MSCEIQGKREDGGDKAREYSEFIGTFVSESLTAAKAQRSFAPPDSRGRLSPHSFYSGQPGRLSRMIFLR